MKLKSYLRLLTLLTGIVAFFIFTASCESDSADAVYNPDTSQTEDPTSTEDPDSTDPDSEDPDSDNPDPGDPDSGELNSDDQESLYFMLEEEKLARDVYTYLGALWEAAIFENITQSEIQHVAAVETLLTSYGLEYEILDPGTFEDTNLQELYDSLTEMGAVDLEAALRVGATIEDLDILDLQQFIDATDTEAIQAVFESLQCGSRNHLRSFISSLENLDASYTPQFISQELYDSILDSDYEQCN